MKRVAFVACVAGFAALLAMGAKADVWSDAILRIRGAVDRNNDGLWTATDYTSANCEIPDVMRAAETAPDSAKIRYNMTAVVIIR
jgi:hypothetical protein